LGYTLKKLEQQEIILEINTTLLREKFIIRDMESDGDAPTVAVSNRLSLPLHNEAGNLIDTLIIRSQNMHHCIRMAAQITQNFIDYGPLFSRNTAFNFQEACDRAYSSYDKLFLLNKWIAVYHKGMEIFLSGTHHPFLNVIEKCDSKNPSNYDQSIKIAEDTFKKMGRKVSISYEANIGMVASLKPDIGRCGLIYRGTEKNATFNFSAEPKEELKVSPLLCFDMSAALLEGLQLSYFVGTINDKIKLSIVKKLSSLEKQTERALLRIEELNFELDVLDNRLKLRFRPEKPEFSEAITDAERAHRKFYKSQN
jgi:hypothetical protein